MSVDARSGDLLPLGNPLLWGCTVAFLVILGVSTLLLVLFSFRVHRDTDARILAALRSHYAPARVTVNDRVDFKNAKFHWSFGGQICFAINVAPPTGVSVERVAMIRDDDDGGAFYFDAEFSSIKACQRRFSRGG